MKRFLGFLILSACTVFSHPLLNVNVDEKIVYDNLEASFKSKFFSTSIKPFSFEKAFLMTDKPERIKLYMNALSDPGYFIKPVNSITLRTFYTSEEILNLENASGTRLFEGLNTYVFLDGYISFGSRAVAYYQLRYRTNKEENKAEIYRGYLKIKFHKFSFQAGKDNVHLGPGEFGLLLSSNPEPFLMVKLQTEKSLNFFGKWDLIFLNGWLNEERRDRDDPQVLALRVVYKPWDFIEFGATRTSLYGGEGRPSYDIWEYPKLILGTEENIPYSKYDTDGYGALDVSVYLPVYKLFKSIKTFKVYYQESGTDLRAWWQKEDREFVPPLGFSFLDKSYVAGVLIGTEKDIIRFEFNRVENRWYLHHLYPVEGYTYRGFSLGHPYGQNMLFYYFKHRRYISELFSIEYRLGYYKFPANEGTGKLSERFFITLSGERRIKNFIIDGFVRIDKVNNYDANPYPNRFNITDKDETFFTAGIGISWRF